MSRVLLCAVLLALLSVGAPLAHVPPQAPPPTLPSLDLVPVNVYVLDKSGKPVTDLKQADFTVAEDGLPQQIRSFSLNTLTAASAAPGAPIAPRKGLKLASQSGRIIAIALGLGRLEVPSGYVSALISFAKTRLLPQDAVAVFVYDRALSFTTDHQQVVAMLERFKKSHEDIDFALSQQLGDMGMAPLYGKRVLPVKPSSWGTWAWRRSTASACCR
jgi:VWFA-related protein